MALRESPFDIVPISITGRTRIMDLRDAAHCMGTAPDATTHDVLYSRQTLHLKALFTYISELEKKCGVEQPITMRF